MCSYNPKVQRIRPGDVDPILINDGSAVFLRIHAIIIRPRSSARDAEGHSGNFPYAAQEAQMKLS